jgi:PAS domain S-box-containing protein
VLCIDDDRGAARLLQKKLIAAGYDVDVAYDGQEGLGKWLECSYGVLATDHDMPKLKGLDLIRELAAKGPLPPTLMITGHGNEMVAVEAMKLGADDYIMKDADAGYLDLVASRIGEALARRKLRQDAARADIALRESEEKFAKAFRHNPQPMCVTSVRDGRFVDVNEAFTETLGYSLEEAARRTSLELGVWGSAEARAAILEEIRENGFVRNVPISARTKKGTVRNGLISIQAIDLHGEPHMLSIFNDLSDRIAAEERFGGLAHNAPFGMMLVADCGAIEFMNPCFREMFGYDPGEIPNGTEWFRKAYPDERYRSEVIAAWLNDFESAGPGAVRPRIWTVRCKDGADKVIHFRSVALPSGGHLVTCEDITERKRMERDLADVADKLRQSVAETQALLSANTGMIESQDFTASAKHVFHACKTITGATAGYVALLSEDGFENEVLFLDSGGGACSVDPSLPMPIRGLRGEAYRTGKVVYDNEFDRSPWMDFMPPGHVALNNVLFAPMLIDGKAVGLLGMANKPGGFNDRDARLAAALAELAALGLSRSWAMESLDRSERRYRRLVENAPIGIISFDREGHISDLNPMLLEILDYRSEPADRLSNILTFPPLAEAGIADLVRECVDKGTPVHKELSYTSSRGRASFLRALLTPMKDKEGQVYGCQAIVEDISERRRSEDLLVQSERLKAVADLSAGVSHNFNNVLQIVVGGTQLGLMNLDSGAFSDVALNLKEVLDSAKRGAETVKRLQDFARSSQEDKMAEGKVLDLSEVVDQALDVAKPFWKTGPQMRGVSIDLNRRLPRKTFVKGSAGELFEVIVNLVKNAVEALPYGGSIAVTVLVEDKDVKLQVEDNGTGIPSEHLKHIFEPFWTSKGLNGTGMGLASSYGIVRRHRGEITVQSQEGHGTTFTVKLPLAEEAVAGATGARSVFPWQLTILVIDDQEPIVKLLRGGLEKCGQSVIAAASGAQGLASFKDNLVDLVICDLGMPGMNGWQVGKAIKEICEARGTPKIPFILLTGWGDQASATDKRVESGVDAVIEKPVVISQVLDQMRVLLQLGAGR